MKAKILIVEDDFAMAEGIKALLDGAGYSTVCVYAGEDALERATMNPPDLVLLDLMMPGMDGYEVCQELRKSKEYIPIIIVSKLDEEIDRIVGLEIGADDYLSKPFNDRELLARVRAVLRLAKSLTKDTDGAGQFVIDERLWIDLDGRCVYVDDQAANLTPKEFDLLAFLAKQPGRVFGREMLLERVWGYDYMGESRTVDVHIQRLRKKIEPDPDHPYYILTVRTIGYKFSKQP